MGYTFHERGRPTVDQDTCTGCGECVDICPDHVLGLQDEKPRAGSGLFMGCIACGHCTMVCPTESIRISGRGMRLEDQRELPPPERRATAEALEALMFSRRSVRKFTEEEVDRRLLERIVEMAATAPMGIPPHSVGVAVLEGRDKVRALARRACPAFGRMARRFNRVVLGVMRPFIGKAQHAVMRDFVRPLLEMIAREWDRGVDKFTYDAPAAMIFHYGPGSDETDCAIVATYAMLAAESLGLGSCMIGTAVALNRVKGLKNDYRVPAENKIGLMLILGHPAVEFQRAVTRRFGSVEFL
jgi:nitroreductase/NAD-dependent dihydropyrimidine dehydrogenase PreA subunit